MRTCYNDSRHDSEHSPEEAGAAHAESASRLLVLLICADAAFVAERAHRLVPARTSSKSHPQTPVMTEIKLLTRDEAGLLSHAAEDVFDDPIVTASTREFLDDPRHRLVVALDDDVIVGFVSAVIHLHPDKSAPELWINEVGVAPSRRRQGLGKMLLHRMLEEAKRSGCTEAWVLTERSNEAGMALYKSVGGIEGEPDMVMFTFKL
jgi:aminoglycoside 6'-N-acetyltransferase I